MKIPFLMLVLFLLSACFPQRESSLGETPETTNYTPRETAVPVSTVPSSTAVAATTIVTTATNVPTTTPTATSRPTMTATTPPPASPLPNPPSDPIVLSFAVIGDYGTNQQSSRDVAALVNSWNPSLVLTVGDNNYPDGAAETIAANIEQHYGRFIEAQRFFPTLGNHDMTTAEGQPYFDYFTLPGNERYYDFLRGPVHFFAINSDWREVDGIGAGSRQAEWLQAALAGSAAPWQVVYFHAPPYVSMAAKQVPALRWPFAAWGADLLLSGHAHLYERLNIDGIPYIVNGLGGGGIYAFDAQPVPGSQVRFNEDYGALWVEATDSRLVIQFITRTGQIIDELQLQR